MLLRNTERGKANSACTIRLECIVLCVGGPDIALDVYKARNTKNNVDVGESCQKNALFYNDTEFNEFVTFWMSRFFFRFTIGICAHYGNGVIFASFIDRY